VVTAQPPPPAPVPVAPPAPAVDQSAKGRDLLAKARLELRAGSLETAHRLTVEVYKGPYGLQDEAAALLRTIAAEEAGQKHLAAQRSFEAGLERYRAKDYAQARSTWQFIDVAQLPPEKRNQLRELLAGLPTGGPQEPAMAANTPPKPGPAAPGSGDYARQVQAMQVV